ncbi:Lys48-specific deubiquitinase [Aureococcus anophagefferens]|nr:Lys48-specific deubiquitinase [Aureococcus anophagefferens]
MAPSDADMEQRFPLKTVMFLGRTVPVLGQNEFGPCALLSVVNALLLQNALELSPDLGSVSLADVVALVGDQILERNSKAAGGDGEAALNTRRAVEEAIALLPTLAGGLDVNVRFAGDSLFEFTGCLGIFDLFDLALVHGWRADPSDPADGGAAHAALGAKSYNEVIARVVEGRAGNDDAEAAAMDDFLSRSATQLTSTTPRTTAPWPSGQREENQRRAPPAAALRRRRRACAAPAAAAAGKRSGKSLELRRVLGECE